MKLERLIGTVGVVACAFGATAAQVNSALAQHHTSHKRHMAKAKEQCGMGYNIARVHAHNFVETYSSLNGNDIHIRAIVSNGEGGTLGRGPFAPIVTLAFSAKGKPTGELKLLFNLPASRKDETYDINIPGERTLWEQSDCIAASAANNLNARPTAGSWQVDAQVGGGLPFVIHPN